MLVKALQPIARLTLEALAMETGEVSHDGMSELSILIALSELLAVDSVFLGLDFGGMARVEGAGLTASVHHVVRSWAGARQAP